MTPLKSISANGNDRGALESNFKSMGINKNTSAIELAAIVSQALEAAGILATLSGGGAVSMFTDNAVGPTSCNHTDRV